MLDEKNMKREWLGEGIPVLMWKGVPLIKIGDGSFVTAQPIGKSIRTLDIAKRIAKRFGEQYLCNAQVSNELEWMETISVLKKFDFAAKEFVQINELDSSEALLLNSKNKEKHLLAAGKTHELDETFDGFISDYDANGIVQPPKLVFVTIK